MDLLLTDGESEERPGVAEQMAAFWEAENLRRARERRRNVCFVLGTIFVYLIIYMLGRIICMGLPWITGESLHWWLTTTSPRELSYLYGWLLKNNLFGWAMVISAFPAAFGKYKFSITISMGFAVGLVLGELCGHNPAGAKRGLTHYGWEIWLLIFLFSAVMGVVLEKISKKNFKLKSKKFLIWVGVYIVGIVVIVLLVRANMWRP